MDHIWNRRFVALLATLTTATLLAATSPAAAKKQPDNTVSEIRDSRIEESSGLAVSVKHGDLVYTINDEGGSGANVYAIKVSTGEVVGVADISDLPLEDPESITVDARGTLWLGDLGDNDHRRNDVAIYAFPEPGPGTSTVRDAQRYRVSFPDGPLDVEGLLVHPQADRIHVVSKNEDGNGRIFELPDLNPGGTVQARDIGEAPEAVTDATFTHDGRRALLRTEDEIWVYDPTTWESVGRIETPKLKQGESVTVEPGDRTALLSSEGKNSPIVRVALPERLEPVQPDAGNGEGESDAKEMSAAAPSLDVAIPIGLTAAALLVAGVIARRRLRI